MFVDVFNLLKVPHGGTGVFTVCSRDGSCGVIGYSAVGVGTTF